jgi:hypothetical protein
MTFLTADMELYEAVLVGRASAVAVTAAFTGIQEQTSWNGDVLGGDWLSGTPGAAGSERRIRLTRGMWQHQRLLVVEPGARVEYEMLEGGGGMPFESGSRIDVRVSSVEGGLVELRFTFHYRLTFAYRLMAPIVRRMAHANLDASLPRLFESPPERR